MHHTRNVLTANASVIRLDMGLLDLAVLDNKGVPLAPWPAEDGSAVEVQVEGFGEGEERVA